MFAKIKRFLLGKGWYSLPKWQRHMGGTVIIAFIVAGIFQMVTGEANFVAGSLIAWMFGFTKELVEHKGLNRAMWEDVNLNTLGSLIALIPWFVEQLI